MNLFKKLAIVLFVMSNNLALAEGSEEFVTEGISYKYIGDLNWKSAKEGCQALGKLWSLPRYVDISDLMAREIFSNESIAESLVASSAPRYQTFWILAHNWHFNVGRAISKRIDTGAIERNYWNDYREMPTICIKAKLN